MRFLSLFSGIGGLDLGLEWAGWTPAAFCEQDEQCRWFLRRQWPGVACHNDVRTLDPDGYGRIDAIVGGFPCQDISSAGKGAGLGGERSGLWWEMHRAIRLVRPLWVIAENVPALRTRGADGVLESLEGIGYTARAVVVGADSLGAPHRRKRVFIIGRLADTDGQRDRFTVSGGQDCSGAVAAGSGGEVLADGNQERREPVGLTGLRRAGVRNADRRGTTGMADSNGIGRRAQGHDRVQATQPDRRITPFPPCPNDYTGWRMVLKVRPELAPAQAEPGVCRVADGVPVRVARRYHRFQLRSFGNAVCPQVGQLIGETVNRTEAAFLLEGTQ